MLVLLTIFRLDGWLTPRSRYEPRNDFVVIQLATLGVIKDIIIDTTSFIGNIPKYISIEGCNSNEVSQSVHGFFFLLTLIINRLTHIGIQIQNSLN